MIDSSAVIDAIKNNLLYRGQLISKTDHSFKKIEPDSLNVEKLTVDQHCREFLCANSITELYSHQARIFDRMVNHKNTMVSMVAGCGVRKAIDLAVFYLGLYHGKTISYVVPNATDTVKKRLRFNAQKLAEYLLLDIAGLQDKKFDFAQIVVLTPEELFQIIAGSNENHVYDNVVLQLDLLVLHDIHLYDFIQLAHLKQIIKLIEIKQSNLLGREKKLQTVMTIQPVANKNEVYKYFFTETEECEISDAIISQDAAPKNPFELHYWMVPLETKEVPAINEFSIRRLSVFDDLYKFLGILNNNCEKLRVLIWFCTISVSQKEKQLLEQFSHKLNINIDLCEKIEALPMEKFRFYDVVVTFSVPQYTALFTHILGNLVGNSGGMVFVFLNEGFRSTQLLKSKRFSIENGINPTYKVPMLFMYHDQNVERYYFQFCLDTIFRGMFFTSADLEKYYTNADEFIDELLHNSYIVVMKHAGDKKYRVSNELSDHVHTDFLRFGFTSFDNARKVVVKEFSFEKDLFIEAAYADLYLQDGMVVYIMSNFYKASINQDGEIQLIPHGEGKKFSFPTISKLAETDSNKVFDSSISKFSEKKIQLFVMKDNLDLEIDGFKTYSNLSLFEDPHVIKRPKLITLQDFSYLKFHVDGYDSKEDLNAFNNLILQFIDSQFINMKRKLFSFVSSGCIYLVPLFSKNDDFINSFRLYVAEFYSYLKYFAFDLFLNCICEDGCPLCIKELSSQNSHNDSVRKNGMFEVIGDIADSKMEVNETIENRSVRIPGERINSVLVYWRENILSLFQERFEMKIDNPVPIYSSEDLGRPGIIGLFDHRSVQILGKIGKEKDAVEVIAHEYVHNWQDEKMHPDLRNKDLPFDGKIFLEGFAQWGAFRVMDFYGLFDNMESIQLRGIDQHWKGDEYGLGFLLCKYIEDNLAGFKGLINFMQTAELNDKDGKKITIDELLIKSGITTRLGLRSAKN